MKNEDHYRKMWEIIWLSRAWLIVATALMTLISGFVHGQSVNQIISLSPNKAEQGTSGLVVTFQLDTDAPPAPPSTVLPSSVKIGTNAGSAITHSGQYAVSAVFNIPASEPVGLKDVSIVFAIPNGTLAFNKSAAFEVIAGSGLVAGFSLTPSTGTMPLSVGLTNTSSGDITGCLWSFGDGCTSTLFNPVHVYTNAGSYTVSLTVMGPGGSNSLTRASCVTVTAPPTVGGYAVVDTSQARCYNNNNSIAAPGVGQPFYGQDAQCAGPQSAYALSDDGLTVYDKQTGLTWQRSPDITGDGILNSADKLTWQQAQARPAALNIARVGGFSDWRLPTIKELYSLIQFNGTDPSGLTGTDTSGPLPLT